MVAGMSGPERLDGTVDPGAKTKRQGWIPSTRPLQSINLGYREPFSRSSGPSWKPHWPGAACRGVALVGDGLLLLLLPPARPGKQPKLSLCPSTPYRRCTNLYKACTSSGSRGMRLIRMDGMYSLSRFESILHRDF